MSEMIQNGSSLLKRRSGWAWLLMAAGLAVAGCSSDDGGDGGDGDDTGDASPTADPTSNDQDGDGVIDADDNCPEASNANQADADNDGTGNVCDSETCDGVDNNGDGSIDEGFDDSDDDGVADCADDCADDPSNDVDEDGVCGDIDNCPDDDNDAQTDSDDDGEGDACDACPQDAVNDADEDGVCETTDNCDDVANADQEDEDGDGVGSVCDSCPADSSNDVDGDGDCANADNCPTVANGDQIDGDAEGIGDACDNCPAHSNSDQADTDGDSTGDACDDCLDDDVDGDGTCANSDNCPEDSNENQFDRDGDDVGDVCDPCPDHNPDDPDGDGVCGTDDGHENPDGSLFIYGTFPDNGYQAVPTGSVRGYIYFSQNYEGSLDAVNVELVSETGSRTSPVSLYKSGDEVYFNLSLATSTDYCMLVDIDYQEGIPGQWPLHYTACFTTRQPCGVPIDVGHEAVITDLGDTNQFGLNALNVAMVEGGGETENSYPVVLLLEDLARSSTFPATLNASLGAYLTTEAGYTLDDDEGLTSSFSDCTISATGQFLCTGDSAIFPACVGSTCINLYVSDAKLSAVTQSSGNIQTMSGFKLEGIITDQDLVRIFTELGDEYATLADYIRLDLDLDGDGEKDAASFTITTEPQALNLIGVECAAQ